MKKPKHEITYRKLSELKKLPDNPRQINDLAFQKLIDSIKQNPDYFEARPIILSDRTGELVIIAGNQRFEAARALKLKEVPTFLLSRLTEEREREIIIRDNVQGGEWDLAVLKDTWDMELLTAWGVDLPTWNNANLMTDTDLNLSEEFDPVGVSKGLQRVVFIFDNSTKAEEYLKKLKVQYKKMNNAWQVNLSTQSI